MEFPLLLLLLNDSVNSPSLSRPNLLKPDVILHMEYACLIAVVCTNKKPKVMQNGTIGGKSTNIHVDLDSDLEKPFLEHLQKDGVSAEGVVAFTACEAQFHCGEVIPLWFFRDLTSAGIKGVIFSNPT